MKRSLYATLAFVFVSAIVALSQEVRNEVSAQAIGVFTKDTNGQGVSNTTTQSAGVLAGYRYRINQLFSAEADYGYNRSTERYFTTGGASRIQANVNTVTGDLVVNLPFKPLKLNPYVLGGGGALIFSPTNNLGGSVAGADTQAQGTFVYGGGVDYSIMRHLSLRVEYRGYVYKTPDFGLNNLNTDQWTHAAVPSAGLVVRF